MGRSLVTAQRIRELEAMDKTEIQHAAGQIANAIMDGLLSEDITDSQPEPTVRTFYTSGEMAAKCGIATSSWNAWVRGGCAPQPTIIDGGRRWSVDAVEAWKKELSKMSRRARRLIRNRQKQ